MTRPEADALAAGPDDPIIAEGSQNWNKRVVIAPYYLGRRDAADQIATLGERLQYVHAYAVWVDTHGPEYAAEYANGCCYG